MEDFTVHDGANAEAAGILYSKAMLIFFHHPRRREPPKIIHPERLEERDDALRVGWTWASVREHVGG
jgi:hypothetical protein